MSKILVTGATGFVGSRLCERLLKEGHDVSILSRITSDYINLEEIKDNLDIFIYKDNLEELINFFKNREFDSVIHLASLFISEHSYLDVDSLIDSNIKFSTQIIEAMNLSNCKKIINTSTSWQHYNNEQYNPTSLYAATKEAFETIMKFYAESYNIKCISLELFDTYGGNDTRPKILNLLKKYSDENIELNMSKGEQILDLLHIDDVIDAYLKALEILDKKDDNNLEKYSLQSQNRITLKALVTLYENITNKTLAINWGSRPYRDREVMIPWNKGKRLPGWESKISLEEGIKRVFG